ncbi:MAG: MFS transporter [Actinomycetota bacterium]|nr:MFS transporter [Actinomycetota bacterium]
MPRLPAPSPTGTQSARGARSTRDPAGGTFRSLRTRNYRLFAAGQVVSLSGTWAQRTAQDWLVLDLSGGSGTALGITTGLQFLPLLVLGLWGGLLADRFDKRRLLLGAQAAMGLLALVLGLLVETGAVALWHVYVLAACLGLASVVDVPVRQAFVSEMVGPDDVPNAVSLNSATFNTARIVGPGIGGVAIAATGGTGLVFLANALTYLAVLGGLLAIRPAELRRSGGVTRRPGQLREGLAYVRGRPDLLLPIVLVGVIGTFGLNFQLTLAVIARETFGRGPDAFGALLGALAAGSLLGALLSARRRRVQRSRLVGAALVFGVLEVAVGLMPTYETFLLMLVPTGVAVLTFTTTANATVQLASSDAMRGRVMALYVLVFLGGTPLGAPVVGWLADVAGPRVSLLAGGAVSLVATLVVAAVLARARYDDSGAGEPEGPDRVVAGAA